jgi:oligopeptide transport system ATP-binding protein
MFSTPKSTDLVLEVDNFSVGFRNGPRTIEVVRNVAFSLRRRETLALVGESGSGKSVTSLALMGLTPPPPRTIISGSARLSRKDGTALDLVSASKREMRTIRGNDIAMVFQEPMTSLNPVHTIGEQIAESAITHRQLSKRQGREEALRFLDLVGIPDPRRRIDDYPHQLSGGMRQRVMIALALACEPSILIADEPTTALDVTVQAQILDLLKRLQDDLDMAMIFVTHNLGVVAEIADRVMVYYSGRIVEEAGAAELFGRPRMPYTAGLLGSVPRMEWAGRQDITLDAIPGSAPDPSHLPQGCSFHPRCKYSLPGRCDTKLPDLENAGPDHQVRCVRWSELGVLA